jgi:hypothetical protein
LWPKEKSCDDEKNFYCPQAWTLTPTDVPRCCWINVLMTLDASNDVRAGQILPYFMAMSKAMAYTCVGDAYVLSDELRFLSMRRAPGQIRDSVWTTGELKIIQSLGQVKRLFWAKVDGAGNVIEYEDVTTTILNDHTIGARSISEAEQLFPVEKFRNETSLMLQNDTSLLQKRDSCGSRAEWEYGYDWFG